MKTKDEIISSLKKALEELDITSSLRLPIIQTIEYLQEEPVSEDLMEATNNYCINVRKGYPRVMDETDRYIYNAFKAGANWQKQKTNLSLRELYDIANQEDGCLALENLQLRLSELTREDR